MRGFGASAIETTNRVLQNPPRRKLTESTIFIVCSDGRHARAVLPSASLAGQYCARHYQRSRCGRRELMYVGRVVVEAPTRRRFPERPAVL